MDDKVLKNERCEVLELNSELKSKLNTIKCQANNDRQFFPANFLHVFKLNHNFLIHLQKNMQHLRKSQYLLLLLSLSFSLSHYNLYHHHELDFNHNLSFLFFFRKKKPQGHPMWLQSKDVITYILHSGPLMKETLLNHKEKEQVF